MSNILNEKNGFSMPFLSGYAELRIPILNSDGKPAWPDVFTAEKIDQIRKTVGERHFSAQMMLNYVPPDKIRLDPGGIKIYEDAFEPHYGRIGEYQITGASVYWDPAGGHRNGDHSVCTLIYRDDNNRNVFIHDITYMIVPDSVEYPLSYQCDLVLDFVRHHQMRNLTVETNGIGGALPEILRDTVRRAGYGIQITPITNSRNKQDRILDAIEPLLSTGRLFAHRRITQSPFFSEMLAWTPIGGGEHDDGLDAVAGAIMSRPVPVRTTIDINRRYVANTDFQI
ncbi:MAG: hypothetical protein J6T57_04260 [Alphaproteobacteria bacterium]|nr:hypothetical protein [Alphaproteobacteria bacterium]